MTENLQESATVTSEKKRRFGQRSDKSSSIKDHRILNPCYEEAMLSTKCINDHNGQKEHCSDYFLNYSKCREFWSAVQSDRRKKGIKPYLPEVKDREAVIEQYQHLMKGNKK